MTQDVYAADPRIPEALIQAIRRKECILLVGSGLCRYVYLPDAKGTPPACWKDVLRKLITACKQHGLINQSQKKQLDELVSKGSILEAGSQLQGYVKDQDYVKNEELQLKLGKLLEEVLFCNQAEVGDIQRLLVQIPFYISCTISYDSFIEDAYLNVYRHRLATYTLALIEEAKKEYLAGKSIGAEQIFVLKLLGDPRYPPSLNFGDRYLHAWLKQNAEKAEALGDIFLDARILLIGFECGDSELEKLLTNLTIFNPNPEPDQYFILFEGESTVEGEGPTDKMLCPIYYKDETDLRKMLENIVRDLGRVPVTGEKTLTLVEQGTETGGRATSKSASPKTGPVHLFISWTPNDEIQKQGLLNHLNFLVRSGTISVWVGELSYGIGEKRQISENLEKAEIFLPLMSAEYFNDEGCQWELEKALADYSNDNLQLIPVLNRDCNWQTYFQNVDLPPVFPGDGTSLKGREKQDQAYKEIADTIAKVVEQLRPNAQREQKSG